MTLEATTETGEIIKVPVKFKHYMIEEMIGSGSSSVVCKIKEIYMNIDYAAKVVNRKTLIGSNTMQYFERELRLLQGINHPNIIKIVDIVYLEDVIVVVMDYCKNGDLLNYLIKHERIEPDLQRQIFFQIVSAVAFIHSKGYSHRDIKPENIFLDANLNVKLGDFGLSIESKENKLNSTLCGTIYYSAPEVLKGNEYDGRKADIWSLGVVLFCLVNRFLPWDDNEQVALEDILAGKYEQPFYTPKFVSEIIKNCLDLNPPDRPTATELLYSDYLRPETERLMQLTKNRTSPTRLPRPGNAFGNTFSNGNISKAGRFLMRPIKVTKSDFRRLSKEICTSNLA